MRRIAFVAVVTASVLGTMLPSFAGGQDSPSPCAVHWAKSAMTPGTALTGRLSVDCNVGEASSLDLTTTVSDLRKPAATQTCATTVAAASASQVCAGPTVKTGHLYDLTYSFTAHGRYGALSLATCQDDGQCDPDIAVTDPHCAQTASYGATADDQILTCTYDATAAAPLR